MAMVEMSNQQADDVVQLQDVSLNVVGMEPKLYQAALCGSFQAISCISGWKERVTPTGNNILHIHVGKPVHSKLARKADRVISIEFINKALNEDMGSLVRYSLLWKENDKGDTPLHLAARFGHTDVVKLFLDRVNRQELMRMLRVSNKMKDTALHSAARAGHADVVKLLVEADPNCPHEPNDMCEIPLYLAVERESAASVTAILDACHLSALAHPRGPRGRTPLHAAANWGNLEMVQKLLETDSSLIRLQDDDGLTPLHCVATDKGKTKVLKVLLDHDSNNRKNESSAVYVKDNNGRTALHIAIIQQNWDAMKNLIAYCPDCIEIMDSNGQNVVHYAVKWNCVAKISAFLELGHFENLFNEKDVQGNTPLHILAASIVNAPYHWCLHEASSFIKKNPILDLKAFNRKNLTCGDIIASNKKMLDYEPILQHLIKHTPRGMRINTFEDVDIDIEKAMTVDVAAKLDRMLKASKSKMLVAALIATVSFTSGLTLPGGFNQNPGTNIGMAVLKSKAAFRAFLVSDIIAFSCSTTAILFYFLLASSLSTRQNVQRWCWAGLLTVISLGAMGIALMTGVCAVLPHSAALVIAIWVISAVFFVCYIPLVTTSVYYVARGHIMCTLGSHEILRHRPIIDYRLLFAAWVEGCKFWHY